MPNRIVITDTSCLIALSKIEAIGLLQKLYQEIFITKEISIEFGEALPEWIQIKEVSNKKYQQLLQATLDEGESSAIALALEMENVLLVIDEIKGRKEAIRLGLKITGTLGILLRAKQRGFIEKLKTLLERLENSGFRVSPEIKNEILKQSGES